MPFLQRKTGRPERREYVLSAVRLFQVEIAAVLFAEKELKDKSNREITPILIFTQQRRRCSGSAFFGFKFFT